MGWYITIQQEMRDALGLKGNELLVFAVIHGFSQGRQGCYKGSLAYLQETCGISKHTAIDILKSLVEKGLIEKSEIYQNGVKFVAYSVSVKSALLVKNLHQGGEEIAPNNNRDNYLNNTLSTGQSHFQKPSLEEISLYCRERNNNVDPEQFFNFYESNGWKVGKNPMRDWKAAIHTWEKREKEIPARKREAPRRESVTAHNLRVIDQMYGTNYYEQAMGRAQADEQ